MNARAAAVAILVALFASTALHATDTGAIARELLRLINQERTQRGLQPLADDPNLKKAAQQQVEAIAARRQLSHRFPGQPAMGERLAATGLHFDSAGENAAEVSDSGDPARDAAAAHKTLMLSPPHRQNILEAKYNAAGIAVAASGGHIWVVQDFARVYPELSVTEVEEHSLAALNKLRARHQLPPVQTVDQPGLRQAACRDDVNAGAALSEFTRAQWALVYTVWQVDEWPAGRDEAAGNPAVRSVAIAACPLAQKAGHGEFRVVVLFFGERATTRKK
jgi:uncharacterized protein YkwD